MGTLTIFFVSVINVGECLEGRIYFYRSKIFFIKRRPHFGRAWSREANRSLGKITGPSCSKLTTSLVNDSLKFQTLISQICQYFFVEKM